MAEMIPFSLEVDYGVMADGICNLYKKKMVGKECKTCGAKAQDHPNWKYIHEAGKKYKTIHDAATFGDLDALKYFISKEKVDTTNSLNNTPLHICCEKGHAECVQFLLQHDASVKKSDMMNYTALHWASAFGHVAVAELLRTYSATVDPKDSDGNTPLHLCVEKGSLDMAKWLVGQGADINSPNAKKRTALHIACMNDDVAMVKYLIEAGSDVAAKDNNGNPPIQVARSDEVKAIFSQ